MISFAVFASALPGEFVYDDRVQIVDNDLIKQDRFLLKAVVSDVFAFKGDVGLSWSNYWRPTFVLWLALNYRLFGLEPLGWHVTNVLLHAAVTVVAFGLMRRLGMPRLIAAGCMLIFAVHPVHVESVAWISGSTDMLMALPLLGSFWLALNHLHNPGSRGRLIASLALFGVALGAKEASITFPAIVFAAAFMYAPAASRAPQRLYAAAATALPYAIIAVAYFLLRWRVLGAISHTASDVGPVTVALTAPAIFTFYLRQMFFPYWIGPNYPLRAVTADAIDWGNLWIPLAVVAIAMVIAIVVARRSRPAGLGLALFVFPLAPAFHISAFHPEQIVHDRYLYLPLLGAIIAVFATIAPGSPNAPKTSRADLASLCAALLACIPLALKTHVSNRMWLNEIALWQAAIDIDPKGSFNWTEYGRVLRMQEEYDKALAALDRALEIAPTPYAYLHRAEIKALQGRAEEARADLNSAVALGNPKLAFAAVERLVQVAFDRGEFELAMAHLREARETIPYRKCALTDKLAVVLVQLHREHEAIAELEGVREDARHEFGDAGRMALYRLGVLYAKHGRRQAAIEVLTDFVTLCETCASADARAARAQAVEILRLLGS